MTKAEIQKELDNLGVKYDEKDTIPELKKLLKKAEKDAENKEDPPAEEEKKPEAPVNDGMAEKPTDKKKSGKDLYRVIQIDQDDGYFKAVHLDDIEKEMTLVSGELPRNEANLLVKKFNVKREVVNKLKAKKAE